MGAVLLAVMAVTLAAGNATPIADGPKVIVARAIGTMGVTRDLRNLRTLRTTVKTFGFRLYDGDHSDPPFYIGAGSAVVTDDFIGARMLSQTDTPASFAGPGWTTRTLVTRDVQQTVTTYRGTARTSAGKAPPAWEVLDPVRVLLLADRAPDLTADPAEVLHGARQNVVAFTDGGYRVRLALDAATSLPSAVEVTVAFRGDIALNVWGDMVERTEYMNWNLVDGIRLPFQTDTFLNGDLERIVSVDEAHADVPLNEGDFAVADAARASLAVPGVADVDQARLAVPLANGPDPHRSTAEIAPGVVQFPGSWFVTLVRQPDGIIVIDAPISSGYSAQVIAEARRRFPGVPIKGVITSTAFWWHVAGVREYAAQGIAIYVLDRNEALMRRLLAAPHTIAPDDLARRPRSPILRVVTARTTIGTGPNALILMPIRRATGNMLMTYDADAHLLHTAEMAQPLGPGGAFLFPESLLELRDAVRDENIAVDTIIGMHMGPTPWAAIDEALRQAGIPN